MNQDMENEYLDSRYTKTLNWVRIPKPDAGSEKNGFVRRQLMQDLVNVGGGKIRGWHLYWKEEKGLFFFKTSVVQGNIDSVMITVIQSTRWPAPCIDNIDKWLIPNQSLLKTYKSDKEK